LDLNLYQTVKGMSAGARVLRAGGTLIVASECGEGAPPGSPYERLLRAARDPAHLLEQLRTSRQVHAEQWQAQIQAQIQLRSRIFLHSAMPDADVRACHLEPCQDLATLVRAELGRHGTAARLAVLPQGPLTIPFVR
jgi:nickel-dependent lactate racemase